MRQGLPSTRYSNTSTESLPFGDTSLTSLTSFSSSSVSPNSLNTSVSSTLVYKSMYYLLSRTAFVPSSCQCFSSTNVRHSSDASNARVSIVPCVNEGAGAVFSVSTNNSLHPNEKILRGLIRINDVTWSPITMQINQIYNNTNNTVIIIITDFFLSPFFSRTNSVSSFMITNEYCAQ